MTMIDDVIFNVPDIDYPKFLGYQQSTNVNFYVMTRDDCPNGNPNNIIQDLLEPSDELATKVFATSSGSRGKMANNDTLQFK